MRASPFKVIDIFSGMGGFSLGFEKEGFQVVLANEIWNPAIQTYKANFPDTRMIEGDISDPLIQNEIVSFVAGDEIDILIGGPPCQAYSTDGNRNPDDHRANLFEEYLKILKQIQPKFFLMENVKGILSMKSLREHLSVDEKQEARKIFTKIQRYKDLKRYRAQRNLSKEEDNEFQKLKPQYNELKKETSKYLMAVTEKITKKVQEIGYNVKFQVLNSADFGSPQVRHRVFFFGTRIPDVKLEFPTSNGQKSTTPKEVLDDLKDLPEKAVQAHWFTKHSAEYIEKIKRTNPGDRIYKNYSSSHVRLHPERPCPTVKENHGGVFLHYEKDRALTPRELARLQDFDDDFIFEGVKRDILKQIGNAVPVNLGRAWALHLKQNYL